MQLERLCHIENGQVFWHPHGWTLFRILEEEVRAHIARDYREVRTPQLLDRSIWERSGHWGKFADGMFAIGDAALKPVSCPGHIAIVQKLVPSYRDLPIRLAELGVCHRNEDSGALSGLFRLQQFTQDDGHIFCTDEQAIDEAARFCDELPAFYRRFGFDEIEVALSLRPANRAGDDALWDRAERVLGEVAERMQRPVSIQPGAGAIYGPKLEFGLRDRRGRLWQCGTIQLDLVMPRSFDVRYVAADGSRRHVVMLHRALFGSLERFIAMLCDHHDVLPPWLAPEQVAILPVGEAHVARARELSEQLGLRCRVDVHHTVGRRVVAAEQDGVPFIMVVGDREVADGILAVRAGRDRQWSGPAPQIITELRDRCMQRP
jgi:threonyl-tRNA synthetase